MGKGKPPRAQMIFRALRDCGGNAPDDEIQAYILREFDEHVASQDISVQRQVREWPSKRQVLRTKILEILETPGGREELVKLLKSVPDLVPEVMPRGDSVIEFTATFCIDSEQRVSLKRVRQKQPHSTKKPASE